MRAIDIIEKTKNKIPLTEQEIKWFIDEYVKDNIKDYQVSSWLMAVCINGLSKDETYYLTKAMLYSGDTIDLSSIKGIKVDKHSTGGVGDKVSLVLGPLVAACGCKFAKFSGRGLGHTGGTLDKLESIPGLTINLSEKDFINQVQDINIAIIGQTKNLVPADKKLYALRDVTSTVNSLPLIASSIMSKKLASGSDIICLDVKYGSGAFMKTIEEATELSNLMIDIAHKNNKKVIAFISDMNKPLGKAIGNKLEVLEAINCLKGGGPKDLEDLVVTIASYMIYYSNLSDSLNNAKSLALEKLKNGDAYNRFIKLIKHQKSKISSFESFINIKEIIPLKSKENGYIEEINALDLGINAMLLGAGREKKEDPIDPDVGILLNYQVGDYVKKDDILLYIYKNDKWDKNIIDNLYKAYKFTNKKLTKTEIIKKIIL